jgi:hypothetical protein
LFFGFAMIAFLASLELSLFSFLTSTYNFSFNHSFICTAQIMIGCIFTFIQLKYFPSFFLLLICELFRGIFSKYFIFHKYLIISF